jgi:hypothetical protein
VSEEPHTPADHSTEPPPEGPGAQLRGEIPLQPPDSEVVGAVPPGYDWPTHGGYLGCLIGVFMACPVVGFLGANVWTLFRLSRLGFPLFALASLALVACIIGVGRLGWALGKRFYRYYPQPQPTWGESDAPAAPVETEPESVAPGAGSEIEADAQEQPDTTAELESGEVPSSAPRETGA